MRREIAHFQYALYLGVTQLKSRLPMPDTEEYEGPKKAKPWYSKLRQRPFTPNPTVWRLQQQVRLPHRIPARGRRKTRRTLLTVDKCAPMTDAWWRCVLEGQGDIAGLDEAQILVSQAWGLRFEGGVVVQNAATLRAHCATLHGLEQHKTHQTSLWEEYQTPLHLMRSEHQTSRC